MRYITRNTFKTERYRHDRNDDFIFANDRRSFVSRMPQGGTLNVTKIHSDCVSVHVSKDFVYNFIYRDDQCAVSGVKASNYWKILVWKTLR